jgi:hypothetical protein
MGKTARDRLAEAAKRERSNQPRAHHTWSLEEIRDRFSFLAPGRQHFLKDWSRRAVIPPEATGMQCEGNTTTRRPITGKPPTHRSSVRPGGALAPEGTVSSSSNTPSSLTQAVRAVVRRTDEATLRPIARRDAGFAYEPKTLLTLLSYCYARNIFASADVEDALRRDAIFRQLCNNEFPGARMIRRFRRENREALQRCLADVLQTIAPPSRPAAPGPEMNRVDADEEACRRIMKAVFIDSMASDDD